MSYQRQEGGRQRDWDKVRRQSELPIITIITSTFNVAQDIHWTIDSIKSQTYANIQWIVADGASTDGTVEILGAHEGIIDYWFSEPDTGIYDAWNKALKHVQGDWVQFIGAGDELYEPKTLEKVALHLKDAYPEYSLVYGQVMHISEKSRKELFVSGEPWENYKGRWEINRPRLPPHSGVFHHMHILSNYKFEVEFKIVADSVLLMRNIEKDFLYLNIIVDKMPMGGVSSTPQGSLKSYEELTIANKKLNLEMPYKIKFKMHIIYSLKKYILNIIGDDNYKIIGDTIRALLRKSKIYTVD